MSTDGIPFLILPMVNREYRRLKTLRQHPRWEVRRLAEDLRIYTPGDDSASPYRENPLELSPGIPLDEHCDGLMHCFQGGIAMEEPLPGLLREALERVYYEHPEPEHPPVMADVQAALERVLRHKGYALEANSNIRGASEVRLGRNTYGSLGKVFQCPRSTPSIAELVTGPSVIEMDNLVQDQACLLSLFILKRLREYFKTTPWRRGRLRLVLFIDEAHLLVGRSTDATPSESNPSPKVYAANYVARMLAEMRALGVGIVPADQTPAAVAPEVIKHTLTKVVLPMVHPNDRKELGDAMLLDNLEKEELARLEPGQAYLLTQGYHKPRRIRTVNPFGDREPDAPPLGEAFLPHIRDDDWYVRAALARQEAELGRLREVMDTFGTERMGFVSQTKRLLARFRRVLTEPNVGRPASELAQLIREATSVRGRMQWALDTFILRHYRPLLGPDTAVDTPDGWLGRFRAHLINRYETITKPYTDSCLNTLDNLIGRCRSRIHQLTGE